MRSTPVPLDRGCHVDEHERACERHRPIRRWRASRPAHRAMRRRSPAVMAARGDCVDVVGEGIDAVVGVVGPRALAVAAQVDPHRVPTAIREHARCGSPRVTGLAAAVEEQHGWVVGIAERVGAQARAAGSDQIEGDWVRRRRCLGERRSHDGRAYCASISGCPARRGAIRRRGGPRHPRRPRCPTSGSRGRSGSRSASAGRPGRRASCAVGRRTPGSTST